MSVMQSKRSNKFEANVPGGSRVRHSLGASLQAPYILERTGHVRSHPFALENQLSFSEQSSGTSKRDGGDFTRNNTGLVSAMSRGKTTPDTPTNTMSIESKDDLLVLLDERIRRISQEVASELVGQPSQSSAALIEDIEAANIQKALQRIMVKEFISIREAHLLLCCSDGHLRNLVDKARKKKTSHPIPFLDLDGVTVFQRVKLLEWAEQPKQKLRAAS